MNALTKEAMAALLHGREYRNELPEEGSDAAGEAGLVVVFGASDDLMEFDGAISDEVDCCNGGTALVDSRGLLNRDSIEDGDDEAIADYVARKAKARSIRAVWGKGGVSWSYETDIPHATFDVLEDGEVFCRGIVFALADLEVRS
jgi:hypothetical protein